MLSCPAPLKSLPNSSGQELRLPASKGRQPHGDRATAWAGGADSSVQLHMSSAQLSSSTLALDLGACNSSPAAVQLVTLGSYFVSLGLSFHIYSLKGRGCQHSPLSVETRELSLKGEILALAYFLLLRRCEPSGHMVL